MRTIPEEPLSHVKGFHEDKLDKIGEVAATFLYLWFSKSGITLLDEQVSSTYTSQLVLFLSLAEP